MQRGRYCFLLDVFTENALMTRMVKPTGIKHLATKTSSTAKRQSQTRKPQTAQYVTPDRGRRKQHSAAVGRVAETAYKLFYERGINAVGVEDVVHQADAARMTLYRHYKSKGNLVRHFLDMYEQRWTREWLEKELTAKFANAEARLTGIFDLFDGWFSKKSFRGCAWINAMTEADKNSSTFMYATEKLSNVRKLISEWARAARLDKPKDFAEAWQVLMNGAIVSAQAGNKKAARQAKDAATRLLAAWPRAKKKAPTRKSRR